MPLMIKNYKTITGLSAQLHVLSHKKYIIYGPKGLGLRLNTKSEGNHIIFAGGTGILPFLDLFDFLLKKSV